MLPALVPCLVPAAAEAAPRAARAPSAAALLSPAEAGPASRSRWTLEQLSNLFRSGVPSNDLEKVGLTVHCFDNTEDEAAPWKPCSSGWCSQFGNWWSTSIINAEQHNTYGASGIVLSPSRTEVLCSWWGDMGTMTDGCNTTAVYPKGHPFPPDHLKDMLEHSMTVSGAPDNEVLIDSALYLDRLPGSVAAVMYFHGANDWDQLQATRAYVAMLDAYELSESELPLLEVSHNAEPLDGTGAIMHDVSSGARAWLQKHPWRQYRKQHPREHRRLRRRFDTSPPAAEHANRTARTRHWSLQV